MSLAGGESEGGEAEGVAVAEEGPLGRLLGGEGRQDGVGGGEVRGRRFWAVSVDMALW